MGFIEILEDASFRVFLVSDNLCHFVDPGLGVKKEGRTE